MKAPPGEIEADDSPGQNRPLQSPSGRQAISTHIMDLLNAFTVDVEDYFQVSAFENDIKRDQWSGYTRRVVANTRRILALMDKHDVRGTFFVLGWIASLEPELVREIHRAGHEIASHGYWHRLVYRQTPERFREDIRRSRDLLQDITGEPVVAYRAPSFSITKQSLWALDILIQEGFTQDYSIFPIHHDRYGIADAEPAIHRISSPAGVSWEFPASTRRFAGFNMPVSGGGYFRLYPTWWTIRCLKAINRKTGFPFVFYVHPWELDPEQPRLNVGSRGSRVRHYLNLSATEKKLDVLLSRFRFGRSSDVIRQTKVPSTCPFPTQDTPDCPPLCTVAENGSYDAKSDLTIRKSSRCEDCIPGLAGESNAKCPCHAPIFELASSS